MPIRVALIEDDEPFASVMQQHFALTESVTCEVIVNDVETALHKVSALTLDLLVVDISPTKMTGVDFVSRITQRSPKILVLILTQYEESSLTNEILTSRERDVFRLMEKGYLYKEIAQKLGISKHTVNSFVRRIYKKMHVRSRSQAMAKHRELDNES